MKCISCFAYFFLLYFIRVFLVISPSCLFEIRHRPFLWCLDWAISSGLYVSDVGVYFLTLFALIPIDVLVRMCCGDLAGF